MIHICFQNLEMNKRLAYGGISTELYNKSLAYSYTKFIGNFEETVRLSFNPINHDTTGNYIVGSRCSAITPWKHGRVLVLKGEGSDPYDASQQKYQVIDSGLTFSTPTRIFGMSTGVIDITLLQDIQSTGYEIIFDLNGKCKVFSGNQLIDQDVEIDDTWSLEHVDKIRIVIHNSSDNAFMPMDRFRFSVLNDNAVYSKIEVE